MTQRILLTNVCLMFLAVGCGPSPETAQIAREAADRQAAQNEQMAKLSEEMARNSQRAIEADAESRREVHEVQQDLIARDAEARRELNELQQETQAAVTAQQARIDQKCEALDQERREVAAQRHRDPILAAAIQGIALTAACLLPILLAAYLLYSLNQEETSDGQLAELLVREIASEKGMLLGASGPPGPALTCLPKEKERLKLSTSESEESGKEETPSNA